MKSELSVYRDKDGSCSIWRGEKVLASGLSDDDALAMAAGPELLEALRESERVIRWAVQRSAGRVRADVVGGWMHQAERASAAIAKAYGGGMAR
jgi:hypothetical protein